MEVKAGGLSAVLCWGRPEVIIAGVSLLGLCLSRPIVDVVLVAGLVLVRWECVLARQVLSEDVRAGSWAVWVLHVRSRWL